MKATMILCTIMIFFLFFQFAYDLELTLDYYWLLLGYNRYCNLSHFCVSEDFILRHICYSFSLISLKLCRLSIHVLHICKSLVGLGSNDFTAFLAWQEQEGKPSFFHTGKTDFGITRWTPYSLHILLNECYICVINTQVCKKKYKHRCRPVWHMRPSSRSPSEVRGTVSCLPCIPVFSSDSLRFA